MNTGEGKTTNRRAIVLTPSEPLTFEFTNEDGEVLLVAEFDNPARLTEGEKPIVQINAWDEAGRHLGSVCFSLA